MKPFTTWLIALITLTLPVIRDLFIPFDFSDWRKLLVTILNTDLFRL